VARLSVTQLDVPQTPAEVDVIMDRPNRAFHDWLADADNSRERLTVADEREHVPSSCRSHLQDDPVLLRGDRAGAREGVRRCGRASACPNCCISIVVGGDMDGHPTHAKTIR
jgi:hypothetical protein